MKKIKDWIIYQYNSIYNHISFWYKKNEADRMHKLTGKRYHVVPTGRVGLMVVNNDFLKGYNKTLPKSKRITINDLLRMSYYSTSVEPITRKK